MQFDTGITSKAPTEITFQEFRLLLIAASEYYGSVTVFARLAKINPVTVYSWLKTTKEKQVNVANITQVLEFLKLKIPPPKRQKYCKMSTIAQPEISGYFTVSKALREGNYLYCDGIYYVLKDDKVYTKTPQQNWHLLHMPVSQFHRKKFKVVP